MVTSIEALDLPIQFFAVGTTVGMFTALMRHRRTGRVDHWPVHIATWALGMFALGLLISLGFVLS